MGRLHNSLTAHIPVTILTILRDFQFKIGGKNFIKTKLIFIVKCDPHIYIVSQLVNIDLNIFLMSWYQSVYPSAVEVCQQCREPFVKAYVSWISTGVAVLLREVKEMHPLIDIFALKIVNDSNQPISLYGDRWRRWKLPAWSHNSSSTCIWPHTADRNVQLLQLFHWYICDHPYYDTDLEPIVTTW